MTKGSGVFFKTIWLFSPIFLFPQWCRGQFPPHRIPLWKRPLFYLPLSIYSFLAPWWRIPPNEFAALSHDALRPLTPSNPLPLFPRTDNAQVSAPFEPFGSVVFEWPAHGWATFFNTQIPTQFFLDWVVPTVSQLFIFCWLWFVFAQGALHYTKPSDGVHVF